MWKTLTLMKINWVNTIIVTVIAALLAWWLWEMGIGPQQKWLLAAMGGAIVWTGLLGSIGVVYAHDRSGLQIRIVMRSLALIVFVACCIYSFFSFSPIGFCVPVGIFSLLTILAAIRIYHSKM